MKKLIKECSTAELESLVGKTNVKIIDIRPVEAYNGWRMMSEARGGHIRGAKSVSSLWSRYIDWIEIIRSKKIVPSDTIVIYGYSSEEAAGIASMFDHAGYSNIRIYDRFIEEWSANPALPMDRLERYSQLVYPAWVKELISGGKPGLYANNNFVICHAHYRNREAYLSGHIPGAIDIDTLALESPETWNRRSPEELGQALLQHGITADTTVVVYGKFMFPDHNDPFPGSAAGHLGAMRCAFIMMYAGVRDVRILNGGFQSWYDAGYEIQVNDVHKKPASDFGAVIPAHPEYAVDLPEAKELLKSNTGDLICVRSWNEYIGEVSGYNYIEKKGRIPGAKFSNCGSDAYHMENYCNLDQTTREYHEIEENLYHSDISREKHNAFYCGTGWRGSEAFINTWLMGWPRVSVYDGGWFEWSSDPDNPIETGIPLLTEYSETLAGLRSDI
jgi:3-mercaptopyruvate sulfurtransferase SseA